MACKVSTALRAVTRAAIGLAAPVMTLGVVALGGIPQAHAANVSGTYIMNWTEICQALQNETLLTENPGTTDTDLLSMLNSVQNGKINQWVGYATFTPTVAGGLSGALSVVNAQTKGSLLVTGLPGPPATPAVNDLGLTIGSSAAPVTGTFSFKLGAALNPGSVTFVVDKAVVLPAFFGQGVGGTITHFEFVGLEPSMGGKACSVHGSAQRR